MALNDPYASLTELKDRLGITDDQDNDKLSAVLLVASRGIEQECRRQFNDAGTATARVYYPRSPWYAHVDDFSTTTGLVVATDAGSDGTFETTWTSSEYELSPLNGIVDGQTGWPYSKISGVTRWFPTCTSRAPLQVTARWGWTAVPTPIKEATLILAEDLFKLRDTPFGAGGYADYGRIKARENPNVCLRIAPYIRNVVLVA